MSSRVHRLPVAGWAEPDVLRARLFGTSDWQIWLDAGPHATGGHSYIGVGTNRAVMASVSEGCVTELSISDQRERTVPTTIFEYLRDDLASRDNPEPPTSNNIGFRLGWVGWFGYELGEQTMGAPVPAQQAETPDACLIFIDRAVEFDHARQEIHALWCEGDEGWADMVAVAIADVNKNPHETSGSAHAEDVTFVTPTHVTFRVAREDYESLVVSCQREIERGNAYQLCLTNRIEATFAQPVSPFDIYHRLRHENPTHHGGLLICGNTSLLSSSPEVFLRVDGNGHITTKPIKGTRPRGETPQSDRALADELRTSEKERAENLMIVDLMRNDVGRVSRIGSVSVEQLLDVETYASVHQLVSTVGGDLAPGLTAMDALQACFPAGSMTGAPKLAAMRILNQLESAPRGIYSGAFGYLSLDGCVDLAMVIRSIVVTGDRASIGTGGGITSGSVPSAEWEETLVKARPLLRALGVNDETSGSPAPAK